MKKVLLALCAVSILALAGCGGPYAGLNGGIYTDVKFNGPGDNTAAANYTKTGSASCKGILGLVATGDCSVDAAMKNGGLKKVTFVDVKGESILGIINTYTTIVYGD